MSKIIRLFLYKNQVNQCVSRNFRLSMVTFYVVFLGLFCTSNSLFAKNTKKLVSQTFLKHTDVLENKRLETFTFLGTIGCDSLFTKFSINKDTQCLTGNSFTFTNESIDSSGQI
jgi:hypothetical protein